MFKVWDFVIFNGEKARIVDTTRQQIEGEVVYHLIQYYADGNKDWVKEEDLMKWER